MGGFPIGGARVALAPASDVHRSEAWEGEEVGSQCVFRRASEEVVWLLASANAMIDVEVMSTRGWVHLRICPTWGVWPFCTASVLASADLAFSIRVISKICDRVLLISIRFC